MPSDGVNQATRQEWRELGFFYDRDDEAREWRLVGSRAGLLRFRDLLLAYIADPRNSQLSEHGHYGPYIYLKVMTWSEAGLGPDAIYGTIADLGRLAQFVEAKLSESAPGSRLLIREEFSPESPYELALYVREDGFDPAVQTLRCRVNPANQRLQRAPTQGRCRHRWVDPSAADALLVRCYPSYVRPSTG